MAQIQAILPSSVPEVLLRRFLQMGLREHFSDIHAQCAPLFAELIEGMRDSMPQLLRSGHAHALASDLVPQSRVDDLARMRWFVLSAADGEFLLPDCAAIGRTRAGDWTPCFDADRELDLVAMPLTSRRLLVGRRDDAADFDSVIFNERAAQASVDFFVAATPSDAIRRLVLCIGHAPRERFANLAREAVDDVRPPGEAVSAPVSGAVPPWRCDVSFRDCADPDTAHRVARLVGATHDAMATMMPLNRIDAVIFAHDYEAAVAEPFGARIERAAPSSADGGTHAIGVARNIVVERDGQLCCRLVLRSWVCRDLALLDESGEFSRALHVLASMLAQAAFVELVDSSLPELHRVPPAGCWSDWFFRAAVSAPSCYFSARSAATIHPDAGAALRTNFLKSMQHADEIFSGVRQRDALAIEFDVFASRAHRVIAEVLAHAASLLGHYDGVGGDFRDAAVTQVLNGHGLQRWVDVYRMDLERLYERRGRWTTVIEFTALGMHSQRMIWCFGVFAWQESDRLHMRIAPSVSATIAG
jgi:hypothetical protein